MTTSLFLLADSTARTNFEFGRDLSSPIDWILPTAILLLLAWFVIGMYVMDCVELGGRFATVLISLRLLALVGLLAVYLQPQWRSTRDVVDNSRVLMLVDTSQSMGRKDVPSDSASGDTEGRLDRVTRELSAGTLLNELRQVHDVVVYGFDEEDRPMPIGSLPKLPLAGEADQTDAAAVLAHRARVQQMQWRMGGAGVALLLAILLLGWYFLKPAASGRPSALPLVGAGVAAAIAVGVTVWALVGAPDVTVRELLALDTPAAGSQDRASNDDSETELAAIDWNQKLTAQGADTKIGQAVYQLIVDQRATPVAGLIVLSDGQRTAGMDIDAAAKVAAAAEIPVHTIGFGAVEEPEYVRLVDFAAPARAYQDDPFVVTAYLQSQGLAGRTAEVTLSQVADSEASQQDAGDVGIVYQVDATLGADSEDVVPVVFDVEGIDSAGRYAFELDVALRSASAGDPDSTRRFYIDVVEHRTRVLLVSGGPSREYQFVRNLLRRDDKQIQLDVFLQSKGVSAASDPDYLSAFPDREELSEYDAVIAIDPAWGRIGAAKAAAIEAWVGDEAGGLIVVPGAVNAGSIIQSWIHEPDYEKLRDLYPVTFHEDFERPGSEQHGSRTAKTIEFTRSGIDADFLRLDDNPVESQRIWAEFAGIYGGHPVKETKLGATVYATYYDDLAESLGFQPVFLAGQFYGKGRVFYLGSGEIWRLRRLDDSYFEQFYTRLIRHVSMGRLHRGSARGDVLLLEKESYSVGDTVPIVAQLLNAQREPYTADKITMFVFDASDKGTSITLTADPVRPGTYRGEFVVRQAQDYRFELQPPESDDDPLSKIVKVTTSDREKKNPQQDDQSLKRLAATTSARYFGSVEAALGQRGDVPLAPGLEDQTRVTPVSGDLDPIWATAWSKWMMFVLCGVLCLEWLLRRLFKLA